MKSNIIIVGLPRVGKSTLLKEIVIGKQLYGDKLTTGLITTEILENKQRVGFKMGWVGYEDDKNVTRVIAHKKLHSNKFPTVSNYGVDVNAIKQAVEDEIDSTFDSPAVYYLDEIGEMQLHCREFKNLATSFLEKKEPTLMTMTSVFENPFIKFIKRHKNVIFVNLTADNREKMKFFISKMISKIEKAEEYAQQKKRWKEEEKALLFVSDSKKLRMVDLKKNTCSCEFFRNHEICSHILAAEELFPERIKVRNVF